MEVLEVPTGSIEFISIFRRYLLKKFLENLGFTAIGGALAATMSHNSNFS